jgi:4-hydroxy 2-oxovalerate aldolase
MGNVRLLDCTLRDGGYINDWRFGKQNIVEIVEKLQKTNVEIIEVGFLKDERYYDDRTVFNDGSQVTGVLKNKRKDISYAMMAEVVNPLPLDKLSEAKDADFDIIRVIVWKKMLKEGYEYCKGIVEKGYKLCVQPARVDQYSYEEFIDMLKLFNTLNPLAIYVVDSWGTQSSESLLTYIELANMILTKNISIGYHGHNNLMQAFQVAVDFVQRGYERDIIVDASVYGIGRGAGNLNTELIAKYLNEKKNKNYNISPMIDIYDAYLKEIYNQNSWGFSIPHYITATYNCNPNFGAYYDKECAVCAADMENIIKNIPKEDRIIFSKEKADMYLNQYYERGVERCG